MASAIGQVLDIPIIIRSLAASLSMIREESLPIKFEPDFLLTMDIGSPETPAIAKFENAWWKGRKPRTLDLANILDSKSLQACLDTHREQLANPSSDDDNTNRFDAKMPASTSGPVMGVAGADITCQKCVQYKDILSDTLSDMLDLHKFSSSIYTASETQWKLDMRSASTFNLLYEAALIKETDIPARAKPTPASITPASVAAKASQELVRLKALPTSSHKWTWGSTLTEDDVLGLNRSGTRPNNHIHSGYDISLEDGRQMGEDTFHSMPTSHALYSDPSVEVYTQVPESHLADNPFFSTGNRLRYHPLSNTPATPAIPAQHISTGSTSNLVIAERWEPESDEDAPDIPQNSSEINFIARPATSLTTPASPKITFIADEWIPASDEERLARPATSLSTPATPRISFIAEEWIPASDEDVPGSSPNTFIADKWIPASEDEGPAPNITSSAPQNRFIGDEWIPASDEASDDEEPYRNLTNQWVAASDEDLDVFPSLDVGNPSADVVAGSWLCESDEEPPAPPPDNFLLASNWETYSDDIQILQPKSVPAPSADNIAASWDCASEGFAASKNGEYEILICRPAPVTYRPR